MNNNTVVLIMTTLHVHVCEGLGLGMIMTILYSDCYNYRFRVIFGRCIFVASSDFMFYIWTSHSDGLISLTSSVITSSPTINICSSSRSFFNFLLYILV